MGSRSGARAPAKASGGAPDGRRLRPATVVGAAVIVALQAVIIAIAATRAGIATAQGRSYQNSSGIALTAIGIVTTIALGFLVTGLARSRRWARTPALLTQLFSGIVGIYAVQGHQYLWGVPLLALAAAGMALLLAPPSTRAFTGGDQDTKSG